METRYTETVETAPPIERRSAIERRATVDRGYANPAPLGFAGFAITLWMVSMVYAGWYGDVNLGRDIMLAITFGGMVMALAGILEFFKGRNFEMILFLVFSAYWGSWALGADLASGIVVPQATAPLSSYSGWYYFLWAILAFVLWIDAFRESRVSMLFTLGLWLTFFALAIAHWGTSVGFLRLGGYLGLITALVGVYTTAAEILNTNYRKTVLPLGTPVAYR